MLQMLLRVPSLPGEVWGPAEVGGEDCRIVCSGGEVRDFTLITPCDMIQNNFPSPRLRHTVQFWQELLRSWLLCSSLQEHATAPLLAQSTCRVLELQRCKPWSNSSAPARLPFQTLLLRHQRHPWSGFSPLLMSLGFLLLG